MKQLAAGVAPAPKSEVTVMIVWPSIAAHAWGRFWGRRCLNSFGFSLLGVPITVGRLMALVSIPFVLPLFFHMLVPRLPFVIAGWVNASCRRYRVTNLRVVVEHGLGLGEQSSVALDRYDEIDVEVLPGQAWFPAGDLVFRLGSVETFRLPGVPRPEQIRQVCLKSQLSFVGVQKVRQAAVAENSP